MSNSSLYQLSTCEVKFIWRKQWPFKSLLSSVVDQTVKNLPALQETRVQFLSQEDPLEKGMATHSRSLPREFNGKSSLSGYSPWGCKESDKTERITLWLFTISHHLLCGQFCQASMPDDEENHWDWHERKGVNKYLLIFLKGVQTIIPIDYNCSRHQTMKQVEHRIYPNYWFWFLKNLPMFMTVGHTHQ